MNFLLRRPIAVVMAFLALFILGIVAYMSLPISLLPKIDIPQITIQIPKADYSAREIEQTLVTPVRRQLLQVKGLSNIESKTRDGLGIIELRFDYGTNTDLAYIEVNEKIDAIMSSLPQGTVRPKTTKASATDVPAFYLNITIKDDINESMAEMKYLELCDIVDNTIRRRIEQLPEVAIADISGNSSLHLLITPDEEKMKTYGLRNDDIETILAKNNVDIGSMSIRDGELEYTIRMSTLLRNASDVSDIYVKIDGKTIQLKDICAVALVPQKATGYMLINGERGVSIAVINKSGEAVSEMRDKVDWLVGEFQNKFPDYKFEVMRNQTQLLDFTIGNLEQNLALSFVLIIGIGWLFLGNWKMTLVVVITLISAIVLSFLPMYCADKTLNIISLSGLILVVGMMIDNALIVTENISQWHKRGKALREACRIGTSEMITPLLSSSLTTMAVFIPLVFISDVASSLFGDQAFVISAGLGVSYIVGIMLLPIVYHQTFAPSSRREKKENRDYLKVIMHWYDRGYMWSMRQKWVLTICALLMVPCCYILFQLIDRDKMPLVDYEETTVALEWGENVTIEENRERTGELIASLGDYVVETSAAVGTQTFIIDRTNEQSTSETELYVRVVNSEDIDKLRHDVTEWLKKNYDKASAEYSHPATIFERLFETDEADVVARLVAKTPNTTSYEIKQIENRICDRVKESASSKIPFDKSQMIVVNRRALEQYNISLYELQHSLSQDIKNNRISELHSYSTYLPVSLAAKYEAIDDVIKRGTMQTRTCSVPYKNLIQIYASEELKEITASKEGEYIPIEFNTVKDAETLCSDIERIAQTEDWKVTFSGAFKSSGEMMKQLIVVLLISFLLMYFILCAQFESFVQPLIVLVEIPIDIAFALLVLIICGETLNLMSAIGIIVSCGIIINDSILKIDTINEFRKRGIELSEAIHEAGRRRLRAIVMTSLTTIGAMIPVLFTQDLGSQLQQPLAIAMIATMILGTLVSLYIVPLFYLVIEKRDR